MHVWLKNFLITITILAVPLFFVATKRTAYDGFAATIVMWLLLVVLTAIIVAPLISVGIFIRNKIRHEKTPRWMWIPCIVLAVIVLIITVAGFLQSKKACEELKGYGSTVVCLPPGAPVRFPLGEGITFGMPAEALSNKCLLSTPETPLTCFQQKLQRID